MDDKMRVRIQLNTLYDMFRDKVEENVVYIVYSENEGRIEPTIDQLMSIAACSFTGYDFQQNKPQPSENYNTRYNSPVPNNIRDRSLKSASSSDDKSSNATSDSTDTKTEFSDENEEDENLDIGEQINRLQKSIEDLLELKKASHDKASRYQSKRMFLVTSYYSDEASKIRRMIENKTTRLVELLLKQSNNANQIDLHGLNPVQARLVVSELLNLRQPQLLIDKDGWACIDIITGWGKHSELPGHRIRAQIVSLLREKGYQYEHLNKGALRVTIRR